MERRGNFVPSNPAPGVPFPQEQPVSEFDLNRRQHGELREVAKNEKAFIQFGSLQGDQIEESARIRKTKLTHCFGCHVEPGIFSVLSITITARLGADLAMPVNVTDSSPKSETTATILWKQRQSDWGLLQGLWANQK